MSDAARASLLERLVLNGEQAKAVTHEGGPQLVFAGAGTGKTRVLTARIAWLIEERKVPAGALFAATFTNKAAREMKSRVESLTGLSCNGLWIGTFHSMCARLLRREAAALGYSAAFSIFDTDDQAAVIRQVCRSLGIEERALASGAARHAISRWKNDGVPPEEAMESLSGYQDRQLARVYAGYQESLRRMQAMDFDDLLSNAVLLLRSNPGIADRYQARFRHVLVDEYQDTNHAQFQLVKILGAVHGNVFVVGDDDQSIYGWRGARVENILAFEREFSGTTVYRLEQNYRSTPAILNFANAVIQPNALRAAKRLWTTRADAADVVVCRYGDDRGEAEGICRRIARLVSSGAKPGDIMVLFRTNAQSRPFEDVLRRERLAYTLVGGISFYQRREIKDCLAYLRLLVNPADDVSLERILNVPSRGLGPRAREELAAVAGGSLLQTILRPPAPDSPPILSHRGINELRNLFGELAPLALEGYAPDGLLSEVLQRTGYVTALEAEHTEESEGRVENINELLNAMALWTGEHPDGRLESFLEEVALLSDIDMAADAADSVVLMTLHSAKGLEARHVFLAGLEDGLLPSRQNIADARMVEEERRLFYVGCTRARETLWCSHAERRWRFGSVSPMDRSRFLDDVPGELYRTADETVARHPPAQPASRSRGDTVHRAAPERTVGPAHDREPAYEEYSQEEVQYRMGQRVRHKTYGIGRILSVSGFNNDMRVTVLFNDGARRQMLARFAGLELP